MKAQRFLQSLPLCGPGLTVFTAVSSKDTSNYNQCPAAGSVREAPSHL